MGHVFVIDDYLVVGSEVHLRYRFDPSGPHSIDSEGDAQPDGPPVVDGPLNANEIVEFDEVIDFGAVLTESPEVDSALRVLLLVAGTSYYKSIAPTAISTPGLSPAERALVLGMYDGGLREFAYRNDLRVPLPVEIIEREDGPIPPEVQPNNDDVDSDPDALASGVLIPVGGGKDSALVADLIPDGVLMSVNPTGAHQHLADALGRPLVRVTRILDPKLREIVAAGARNGHVPVTAINSAIAVALAAAEGLGHVAMGLERSASEPTVVVDGVEVNHQYSKSAEGESLLFNAFGPSGVNYFSLLRPLSELAIGAAVAKRGLASEIVSCNRAFTIWSENDASRTQRACGDCAKCLFTSLMLAPFLKPEQIREQFGRDLLDEEAHVDPVRDLWSDEKPFDCVGERHETAAALVMLADDPIWSDQIVPNALAGEARSVLAEVGASPEMFLRIGSTSEMAPRFAALIESLGLPQAAY